MEGKEKSGNKPAYGKNIRGFRGGDQLLVSIWSCMHLIAVPQDRWVAVTLTN